METSHLLLTLGALLLCGLLADELGRRTSLPRVTLLILFGMIAGRSGFGLVPPTFGEWYEFLAIVALTMVAFLLGGQLSLDTMRKQGRLILWISLAVVVATITLVSGGLLLAGLSIPTALALSGIALATDPATTQDVVRQTSASGPFTRVLIGIVAIDDAWGLIGFSIVLVLADTLSGHGSASILLKGAWEVGGAIALGILIGWPAAYLTGRLGDGEPIQSEALGIVFLCAGMAEWLGVSYLLAAMTTGAVVVNLATHHARPFHEIENIEWPFMVIFFVLAGAILELEALGELGLYAAVYIVFRLLARIVGAYAGATYAGAPQNHRRWYGLALTPQAGIALGMALVAGEQLQTGQDFLLAIVIGSTVFFELAGPLLTQLALKRVGETRSTDDK